MESSVARTGRKKLACRGEGRDSGCLRRRDVITLGLAAGLSKALPAFGQQTIGSVGAPAAGPFVRAVGTHFELAGRPFRVTGVNNHYLTYASKSEVTRVLDAAVAMHANVVRTFLQPVIGSLDGATPTIWDWKSRSDASDLGVNGAYLLYWDSAKSEMAVNTGPNGFQKIDFLIDECRKRGLKLILAFLDFWAYTGGAQQMRAWYGSDDWYTFFFVDPRTRRDYKAWVQQVLTRVNPLTKTAYRDETAIFAWDLMNEPNARPAAALDAWLAEMSAFVKTIDSNHLLASGHGNVGDRPTDLHVAGLDFTTWHGYPLYQKLSPAGFNTLINKFCALAKAANKPVLLEEFGYARSNPDQVAAYQMWLDTMRQNPDCAGWLVWRLVGRQDNGRYPVDNDPHSQFDVHENGGPLWRVLQSAAQAEARHGMTGSSPEGMR